VRHTWLQRFCSHLSIVNDCMELSWIWCCGTQILFFKKSSSCDGTASVWQLVEIIVVKAKRQLSANRDALKSLPSSEGYTCLLTEYVFVESEMIEARGSRQANIHWSSPLPKEERTRETTQRQNISLFGDLIIFKQPESYSCRLCHIGAR
jgi:hypothetical protein